MAVAMTPSATVATVPERRPTGRRYVPALPTLWPSMLAPVSQRPSVFPFDAPRRTYYYLARNALYHGARLLGLEGKEVLVPAYHHGVEVGALIAAGAEPVFVRVDARMRLDLDDAQARIGPRTAAIHVIHYAGFPQPLYDVEALARQHGLLLLEDCALSLFAEEEGRPVGSTGDLSIFCLYKTLPVPNGGVLILNGTADRGSVARPADAPLVSTLSHTVGSLLSNAAFRLGAPGEVVRQLARGGYGALRGASGLRPISTGTMEFQMETVDLGMSALSAIIASHADRDGIVSARRRNFSLLLARLGDVTDPVVDELPRGACPLFYPLLCNDKDEVAARLSRHGVETIDFWRSGHARCPPGEFPEVDFLRQKVLEVPCHQDLGPEDMAHIALSVEEALS